MNMEHILLSFLLMRCSFVIALTTLTKEQTTLMTDDTTSRFTTSPKKPIYPNVYVKVASTTVAAVLGAGLALVLLGTLLTLLVFRLKKRRKR